MAITEDIQLDEEGVGAFAEQLFGAALAMSELTTVYLGRALGLYVALRGESHSSTTLAKAAGVDERYAREWLEQQAVAGIVVVDGNTIDDHERTYALPEEHAVVLLDEEFPAYSGALADIMPVISRTIEPLTDAFRSGAGVPFAAYGVHDMQAGFTRPMFASSLVPEWLPALADVHARLEAGDALRIADFGCGEGWAGIYIAEAYPNVTVDGYDLDDASIDAARRHAANRGVGDRVHFEVQDVSATGFDPGAYDLVLACEVIHDLADPVSALTAMRSLAGDNGAVLIIDENASETFEAPGDEIQRLLYSFSVLHCLPVGRDADESVATGTVMRPATFRGYAEAAGFGTVEVLPVENPVFRLYRLGA